MLSSLLQWPLETTAVRGETCTTLTSMPLRMKEWTLRIPTLIRERWTSCICYIIAFKCNPSSSSNTRAHSVGKMLELRCLAQCLSSKAVSLTCWLLWPVWALCQWLWMEGTRLSGYVLCKRWIFSKSYTPHPLLSLTSLLFPSLSSSPLSSIHSLSHPSCLLSYSLHQYYSYGVYDSPWCSSSNIQHAMVLTGYGVYGGKKYWLLKNRWEACTQLVC